MRLSRDETRELRAIERALGKDPQLRLVFHQSGSSFRYPAMTRRRLAVIALMIGMVLLSLGSSSPRGGMVLMGFLVIVLGGLALSGSAGAAGRRRPD